ncbi:olfactomedin-4-like isoform X2 [Melanotaenia boesemani]|uniref:olfactomedin-4-like isoform X2 n=1 Tax=Melanotaenia boesemani TaxID=1250792 RepID=UPI001C04BD2E|nr:olfactomedin-4-like isoform X2 [Melanotaenia boesemani]
MNLYVLTLSVLFTLSQQVPSSEKCTCELSHSQKVFPHDKLQTAEGNATDCNSRITPQKTLELESLLLGLERRLDQLHTDMSILEAEDDGQLYGVLSLYIIENEMTEIKLLLDKLNRTTLGHQDLTANTLLQVVKGRQDNKHLKADLKDCRTAINSTVAPTHPTQGTCPHGHLLNITGPRVYTAGEYPGSYPFGAWGRDPEPEAGKESWYWLVMLTSSNIYAHYVRLYSSLSALIIGVSTPGNVQIHSSNPTTNTIQGPNVVLYGGALYYNCYNKDAVCRFNLTSKTVTTSQLPAGTRYNSKGNFCRLDECYSYTDLDLATDESGVWVIYTTTQDYGNLVLSKVEEGQQPTLGQTWHTSVFKQSVTNTFMACGILYATRYVSKSTEEIFYSFDTSTGKENFNLGILINKMSSNIQSLNYSPVDQMLYTYCDSKMVSYKVLFG